MATITGSKYSGSISSYSEASRQLTVTGALFASSAFNTPRMVVAYNISNEFMGLAIVRRYINSTNLELESNFFDPITQSKVTVTTGSFEVSNNLVESGGWTASGLSLTQTAAHSIGTSGNERSACIYDEGKIITANTLAYLGGVVLLGRPTQQGKAFTSPCTLRYTGGGTRMRTRSTSAHFFMFGGSLAVQSTPIYFGGYQGSAGGSFLFDNVNTQSADLISVGAGGSWGSNADRHVLRNIKTLAGSNNAISVRWGDGVISGGQYQLIGTVALSIFGTDTSGTYTISAPAGSRVIAEEVGRGSKPALFRSNLASILTVNYDNVVSSDRKFTIGAAGVTNTNGLGIFTYTDAYSNALVGTKIVIVDSSGTVVASGTSNGVDPLDLTVEEARVQGATETVTESSWDFSAYLYGKNIVTGQFATTTQSTIGGNAKNVVHGSVILQSNDASITETNEVAVDAYPITVSVTGNTITVEGNGSTLQNLTAAQLYDLLASFLEDNFGVYTQFLASRSGIVIDATGYNVNLSYINYVGDMITDEIITLTNGSSFIGTRTDANGTVLPLRNVSVTGLSAGSRLCVYNQNTSTKVFNQIVTGTSYTAQYAEGVGYSAGDVLELKVAKINMLEFSTSVVVTSTGWNGLISQETNAIYNAHGVDGSTVTGISWDSGNLEFDFNDSDNNMDGADIGAWYYYFITTEIGIAEAFGALVWSQINKITNATSKVAITFDNVKSSPLQINNCWIDRDDGVSIIASTSNSIQINPPAVFSTSIADVALIKAKTDLLSFTGTDIKATLDGEDVVTDTASRNASKATTTISSNMRGTDGANTVAPTNETLTVAQNTKLMSLDTDNLDVAVGTRATKADVDQALVDYNVDTKTNVKPSIPV